MTTINEADRLYFGDEAVDKVYIGEIEIWPEVLALSKGPIHPGKIIHAHKGEVVLRDRGEVQL